MQLLNGCPVYLGKLVSTGTAVNNLTTATPFLATPLQASASSTGGQNMLGTLAGKMLLIQATAGGFILPSNSNAVTITNQAGANPGVQLFANTGQIVLMNSMYGWMQWLPSSGSANLLIWELV
jgi:hypothetical protein